MSSLLSRFAANIYWLARYLERAECLARILDINETFARDHPDGPDWRRVLELNGDTNRFMDNHDAIDAAGVLNFYILDKHNPTSIRHAVAAARENARTVRHLISTEMWIQANVFHNQIGRLTQRDLRLSNLSRVCGDIKLACQTLEGITEGTLLRGEAWNFYQLGKYIERADQTTRVLDMGYDRLIADDDAALRSVHWNVLLRSVAGYYAFRSRHPSGPYAADVADFLLHDKEFGRAVALCMERIAVALDGVRARHDDGAHAEPERARKGVAFLLETGLARRPTPRAVHKFLDRLQVEIGALSNAIGRTYFGAA